MKLFSDEDKVRRSRRVVDFSFLCTFANGNESSWELSHPGTSIPRKFRSQSGKLGNHHDGGPPSWHEDLNVRWYYITGIHQVISSKIPSTIWCHAYGCYGNASSV